MKTLIAASSKAEIVPEKGGGLAGPWVGGLPVLRPWSGKQEEGPFRLACNLLVPFSNRISWGGFSFEGLGHAANPSAPGEACPIQGDGFQGPWSVDTKTAEAAQLTLPDGKIGPFRYSATVTYRLTAVALDTQLSVTNGADVALPFGIGLHPWFPRTSATRLQFEAKGVWPETSDHLPATLQAVPVKNGGDWRDVNARPQDWINTGFSGWNGRARIVQRIGAVSVRLTAMGLETAPVYSPSAKADFFCFEPVSRPADADNLPGQPGLARLAASETLTAAMTLTWGSAA